MKKKYISIVGSFIIGFFIILFCNVFSVAETRGDPITGRKIYRAYCTSCHGYFGKGDGSLAGYLEIAPRDHTDGRRMNERTDENLFKTINDGGPINEFSVNMPIWGNSLADEFSVNMPIWGNSLTNDQIRDVVAYLRTIHLAPSDVFPNAETFTHELVTLGLEELEEASKRLGKPVKGMFYRAYLYFPWAKGKVIGVVSFENLWMASDKTINVGIGIDNEGKIVSLISLEEHEELGQFTGKFLNQFKGLNKNSTFEVGKDVKVTAGTKEVVQDITRQIKRLYFLTLYAAELKK